MKKEDKIRFLIILGATIVLCQGFLQMHFSSDTYVLWDLGYMQYPQEYFLLDGRLISALACYIGGFLNLPLEVYIVGMNCIAVVLVAAAVYMMSNILIEIIQPQKNSGIFYLSGLAFLLILNQFTLEYLLFPESAVMCLGLMLQVVAIGVWEREEKRKYLKIFILLLVSTICYQGLLNIFPTLVVFIYILKQILYKKGERLKVKETLIEIGKLILLMTIVLVIVIGIIEGGKILLGSEQDRTNSLNSFDDVAFRSVIILAYLYELFTENLNMLPHYINYIIIGATIIYMLILNVRKSIVLQYFLFVIFILILCIAPMYVFNTGPCGRVNSPMAMLWGMSFTFIYAATMRESQKDIKKSVYRIIVISCIINGVFISRNISEHIAANKVEENMGKTIKHAVEMYEEETGIEVTKFQYYYDYNPQQYAVGIKHMGSLTEKKFAVPWSIDEAMDYYCERKFERVTGDTITRLDVDYDEFSEDLIYFLEDTVILIVY